MAIGNLARCVWVCQPARCARCCVWYSVCFVYSLLCLGCLSLLCLVFCVFSVSHVFCVFCVFYVFHVFCVVFWFACLMRTLCSAVFGLASSVVGSCVLGGRGDWGVVGEPIRGGEEGCSGGKKGIERYQNFLTKAAFEHLVANIGYRDLK